MKKLSIKQLVIIFIVGAVLLNGAQFWTMRTYGYDRFDREATLSQMLENGEITEEEMEYYLERDDHHRGFNKSRRK